MFPKARLDLRDPVVHIRPGSQTSRKQCSEDLSHRIDERDPTVIGGIRHKTFLMNKKDLDPTP